MLNNFIEITQRREAKAIIESLDTDALLLFSKTSMKKLADVTTRAQLVDGYLFHSMVENIDAYIATLPDEIKTIYTFGGGTIIDTGKYIADALDIPLICILPMLSTNTFATDKVSLYLADGSKTTLQAKLPDEIILDMSLIKEAGYKSLLGLSEILSIHTALYDWKLGATYNNEPIDTSIYETALSTLTDLNESVEAILHMDNEGILRIYELIGKSGEVTRIYGSGRPESGSEHIFAKVIEKQLGIPHGIAVALGVISMSTLQNNEPDFAIQLLKRIGTLKLLNKYNVTDSNIADALLKVQKLSTRFTILDIKTIDEPFIERILAIINELR
jgi:glycerol dehydrogenase-like iron-containing ADH family enzyme